MPTFLHPDTSIGPVPGDGGEQRVEALVIDIRPHTPAGEGSAATRIGCLELTLELEEPRRHRAADRRLRYRPSE